MHKYCKAYYLKDFRQFPGWTEKHEEPEPALTDDTVAYLWDDFTVVKSPVQNNTELFEAMTPEWQHFCETVLKFEIPEDLRYAYQQTEDQVTPVEEQEHNESLV
jgi:hypothetical protein